MAVFDPEYKHTGLDRIGNIEQYLVNANGGSQTALAAAVGHSGPLKVFMRKLAAAVEPVVVTGLGDSTLWNTAGWFDDLFPNKVGAAFPAYTVKRRAWDATNQLYPVAPELLQTGTAGERRLVVTGASTDKFFSVADSSSTSPTGDLDVRVRCMIPSLTAASYALAGKYDTTTNNRAWFFGMDVSNKLTLFWSTDGTSGTQVQKLSSVVLPNAAVGVPVWLRATLTVSTGAVNFYYSADNTTWTQVGTTVTGSATSIFDAATATQFPGRGAAGNSTGPNVEYYAFQAFSSIASNTAAPFIDIEAGMWHGFGSLGTSATFSDFVGNTVIVNGTGSTGTMTGAPVFYILNGGASGQTISYANDSTRQPKLTPVPSDLCVVAFSHNEVGLIAYRTPYKQLTDALIAKWPDVGIVAVGQNPRFSPATNITEHAIRIDQIGQLAQSQGFVFLDTYTLFELTGNPQAFTNVDGIHPATPAGWALIRDYFWSLLSPFVTNV